MTLWVGTYSGNIAVYSINVVQLSKGKSKTDILPSGNYSNHIVHMIIYIYVLYKLHKSHVTLLYKSHDSNNSQLLLCSVTVILVT